MIISDKSSLILICRFINDKDILQKVFLIFPIIEDDTWKNKCIDKFLHSNDYLKEIISKRFIINSKIDSKDYFNSLQIFPNRISFPNIEHYNFITINKNIFYINGDFNGGNRCVRSIIPYPYFEKPFSKFYLIDNIFKLIPNFIYYYEICILKSYENYPNECISVGFCNNRFPLVGRQVGWDYDSYGLHSDDGKTYHNNISNNFMGSFGEDDYIGCGLFFNGKNYDVFYTKNGKFIDFAFQKIPLQNYFAVIGIDCKNRIKINFGNTKFQFNVMKMQNLAYNNYKIMKNIKKIKLSDRKIYFSNIDIVSNNRIVNQDYLFLNNIINNNINSYNSLDKIEQEKIISNILLSLKYNYNYNITDIPLLHFLYSPIIQENHFEESIVNDSDEEINNFL